MSHKFFCVFFVILAICCFIGSIYGIRSTIVKLNTKIELYTFTGNISDVSFNQLDKYASCYFKTVDNAKELILEIPNLYLSKFDKKFFEENYSLNNSYTFTVLQEEYLNKDDYYSLQLVGIKDNFNVLLDENIALKVIENNSYLGIVLSTLFLVVSPFVCYLGFKFWR